MAREGGAFFCPRFFVMHNCPQTAMLWLIKKKVEVYYCLLLCIDLVCIFWRPTATEMNAVLAIIAVGGRSIVVINREAAEIN